MPSSANHVMIKTALHVAFGVLLMWVGNKRSLAPDWSYDALLICGGIIVAMVLWKQFGRSGKPRWGAPSGLLPSPVPAKLLPPPAAGNLAQPVSATPMDPSTALRAWENQPTSDMWKAGADPQSQSQQPPAGSPDIFSSFGAISQ